MIKKNRRNVKPNKRKEGKCPFCVGKQTPRWEDYEKLKEYLSPRSRLLSGIISGVCVKHQRILARAVKQARHLGLLPFTTQE